MKRTVIISLLLVLLLAAMPVLAQEETADTILEDIELSVEGTVFFCSDGDFIDIVVGESCDNGVVVAPAGAFNPSELEEGMVVIVYGFWLDENEVLKATAPIEFPEEDEPEAEVTPEPEATEEPEATPDPEATEEPVAEEESGCNTREDHPMVVRISDEFGVDAGTVAEMRCGGNGFGNIIRAFRLSEALEGRDPQEFLDDHKNGKGWGNIIRDNEIDIKDLKRGRIDGTPDDEAEAEAAKKGNKPEGKGKPTDKGKPEDKGKPADKGSGKPDNAGGGKGKNK